MVDRPFESLRPVGPFINVNDREEDLNVESTQEPPNGDDVKTNQDPLLETAENWYQSISQEENKRKMMRNYLLSVSDLTESEVDTKLDQAGL